MSKKSLLDRLVMACEDMLAYVPPLYGDRVVNGDLTITLPVDDLETVIGLIREYERGKRDA